MNGRIVFYMETEGKDTKGVIRKGTLAHDRDWLMSNSGCNIRRNLPPGMKC